MTIHNFVCNSYFLIKRECLELFYHRILTFYRTELDGGEKFLQIKLHFNQQASIYRLKKHLIIRLINRDNFINSKNSLQLFLMVGMDSSFLMPMIPSWKDDEIGYKECIRDLI